MARTTQSTTDKPSAKAVASSTSSKVVSRSSAPKSSEPRRSRAPRPLRAIGNYFKGSWYELRQTKWPDRRASWSLTVAVIIFTAVLMLFIVLIDFGFDQLFKQIIR